MAILYGYEVYPDQKITTKLSMAVSLQDDYTEKPPIGSVEVFLIGQEVKSVKNPSGYYLFLDLPGSEYQVRVETEYYFKKRTTVKLTELDPLNPVVRFKLKPKPSYPFSPGTTLIRGMVHGIDGKAVPGANVEIRGKNINNITTEKGEFVLYFKGLTEEDIIKEGNKRFVKGNGRKKVRLIATHEAKTGAKDLKEVREGETTVLVEPIVLKKK
ncbi:MAG: hypothetical protein JSV88_10840 [Candidatus Aminicenantes bacterium]|nr:MAG: hypothetical protein JSV88_10840 [Candidatus Aminicenantes bacterium]